MIPPSRRRDALIGALAGIIGGFILALALQAKGMMSDTAGLIGLTSIESGLALHLTVSTLAGAGYGALFRYQRGAYAAAISTGVIYGLIWWIVGPLTLSPILMGQGPTWSLGEAGASFLNLTGHILFGGITGFSFYVLVTAYERWFPESHEGVSAPPPPRTRVVILGGGFGGVSTAQRLEKLTARDESFDVTLVSQSNYLLFTPMLAEVASSALQAQHISTPVRAACPYTRFLRAAVEGIDTEAKTVRLLPGIDLPPESLEYDHLVLALGSVPYYHGLTGMEAHSFTLKTLEDATRLRNHVLAVLERADVEPEVVERRRQLTFVVVGGGFAGTEVVAELFDLVHGVLHYYPRIEREDLRFVLVHSRDRILPELSHQLAEYSLRKLRGRGIEFLLESRVTEATSEAVKLDEGRNIPTRTIVWTAGNQPNPLLKTIRGETDPRGAVIADRSLRVVGLDDVWAIGDCANVPDPQGHAYPPTAQHALREGKLVAENIIASVDGGGLKEFRYRSVGLLVALGHRTGAAEIMGRRFSGLLAWLLWRGLYLSKLPGLEKKVRVSLDWILDLFFPRDIALTVDTAVHNTREKTSKRTI
ncbi:MAG: NAD(P)/FAD-dependent oxidoreductase [Chloroflexi bacterium]|nr:NAD(P)/FAD-dependent oxidoreductase [Chloroflexota bacterium]